MDLLFDVVARTLAALVWLGPTISVVRTGGFRQQTAAVCLFGLLVVIAFGSWVGLLGISGVGWLHVVYTAATVAILLTGLLVRIRRH